MAMIDAYKIGVELVLGGDLSPAIDALIPGLDRLDASLAQAAAHAKELSASLRGVGGSAAGIGRAADNMGRLAEAMAAMNRAIENWNSGGGMPDFVVPRASSTSLGGAAPRRPRASSTSPGGAAPRGPGTSLVPKYFPNFTMPNESRALVPTDPEHDASFFGDRDRRGIPLYANGGSAYDAVIPALLTGDLLKHIFGASFGVGAKETDLLMNGWTPEQVSKARALAQAVQVSTPGATIGGGLELLKDLGVIFRDRQGAPDVGVALSSMPSMMQDALVLSSRGHGDALADVFRAIQAGDLKGAMSRPGTDDTDPARLAAFVHNEVIANVLSGNRVTPAQMLQNVRTGAVAAAMMDDKEFFGANLAMIEGLGSQAAAALSGFNRQFGAGRMGEGPARELEGVFPQLAGHWHSVGMSQVMVDPGAMGDTTQLAEHPYQFIKNVLMPGIDRLIRERTPGFDALSADQKLVLESQEGSRVASSVTGSRAIVNVMRLWPQMARSQAGFEKIMGSDPFAIQLANNPEMRAKGLGAAWNAFEVSLGEAGQEPAIAALNAITGWLNSIAAWSKANPDGSKVALEGLALGLLALGAEKVLGALAALAGGGKGSLYGLAGGILALGAALDHFPEWLQNLVKGAAVGGMVGGLPGAVVGGAIGAGAGVDTQSNLDRYFKAHPELNPNGGYTGSFGHDLGHLLHLNAYHPDAGSAPVMQPIHIVFEADGHELTRVVTRHQLRMMGGQVSSTLRPDPSVVPQYGAYPVET